MKRLQLKIGSEALTKLEALVAQVNEGFTLGSISQSDIVEDLIVSARIDAKALQRKHVDIKRYLKQMASDESLDLDQAIRLLEEFKSQPQGRRAQTQVKKGDE